ncbi:MAG: hypothetical protein J1E64_14120 [Acetatifactor sp.]|nr:hypothetical protein [Acetatifactor sp.]
MYFLDSEKVIIELFQSVDSTSVYFPVESEKTIEVFETIHSKDNWKLWIESSGKADPPPDFYSDEYKCMMEVMRVDDHSYKNKKGKIVNPTNRHIRDVEKEILQSGIMDMLPNVNHLMINAITDLPTKEDHNYEFYKKNFVRVIDNHKKNFDMYKTNHPNYTMIFFVMDESSAYLKVSQHKVATQQYRADDMINRIPHFWFMDNNFLCSFENSNIDYLIWYTPFKLINFDLPKVCVFDIHNMPEQRIAYDSKYIISAEV